MNKAKISDTSEESVSGSKVDADSPGTAAAGSGGEETTPSDDAIDAPEPSGEHDASNMDTAADVDANADPADVEESADDAADVAGETEAGDPVDADETWEADDEQANLAEDDLGESDFEVADQEANDAAYAHAPTSAEGHFFADDEYDVENARRTEFLWWLLTPLSVLVFAPLVAVGTSFLVALSDTGYPAICQDAAPDNMCEEVVLRMAGQHTIAFGIGWLALWALPWRRRVRPYRIALAVLIVLILLAAPLRLLASVDYHA